MFHHRSLFWRIAHCYFTSCLVDRSIGGQSMVLVGLNPWLCNAYAKDLKRENAKFSKTPRRHRPIEQQPRQTEHDCECRSGHSPDKQRDPENRLGTRKEGPRMFVGRRECPGSANASLEQQSIRRPRAEHLHQPLWMPISQWWAFVNKSPRTVAYGMSAPRRRPLWSSEHARVVPISERCERYTSAWVAANSRRGRRSYRVDMWTCVGQPSVQKCFDNAWRRNGNRLTMACRGRTTAYAGGTNFKIEPILDKFGSPARSELRVQRRYWPSTEPA